MISKKSGIYAYHDNLKDEIIYIGKDSNIEKNKRHKNHYSPSYKDKQVINKILQNDNKSGRYTYVVLEQGVFTNDELNQKEINWISLFKPKFNFTPGGDGTGFGKNHPFYGKHHKKETRKKISEALKGERNPMYKKHHSEESRKKMSEAKKRENHPMYKKRHTKETREKMKEAKKGKYSGEKHPQFNSCIKIRKRKNNRYKQGFSWRAYPHTPEGQKDLQSVNLQKCIEKVENFIKSNDNVYGYKTYEVI